MRGEKKLILNFSGKNQLTELTNHCLNGWTGLWEFIPIYQEDQGVYPDEGRVQWPAFILLRQVNVRGSPLQLWLAVLATRLLPLRLSSLSMV
ncbi:MAG: hypothetical protein ABIJ97_14745 [Bacteroidota bacterium]